MASKQNKEKELLSVLEEISYRDKYDKFHNYYFQDHKISEKDRDISRKNYPKHIEFINSTANYRELALIATNRSGKSDTGAFILAALAMKDYPHWWKGKKFPDGVDLKLMVLGVTNTAVRDVAQKKLMGPIFDIGSGLLPKESILRDKCKTKSGIADAFQDVYVRALDGTTTHIQFGSYELNPQTLAGQELHCIWFDEEGFSKRLYNEILMRTATTEGFLMSTWTPLDGLTHSILKFLPDGEFPKDGIVVDSFGKPSGKFVQHLGWNHAPHLLESEKEDMRKRYFGAELIARTEGLPTIGEGQVYPIPFENFVCEPFAIPIYFQKAYGLDVGWNKTAAVWGALDPTSGVTYIYSEHLNRREHAAVHAESIKARGDWIIGAVDPASEKMVNTADGNEIFTLYRNYGLNIFHANNAVEAGIYKVGMGLQEGSIKIFTSCLNTIKQLRMYRRTAEGKIDKKSNPEDDLCDALRYLIMSGMDFAAEEPDPDVSEDEYNFYDSGTKNAVTGY